MNGPLPPRGLRKTVNGGQYAFKWVTIEGLCQSHLYVTVPAGGAMTITEYLHEHVFRAGLLTHMTFGADWILSWFNMFLACC